MLLPASEGRKTKMQKEEMTNGKSEIFKLLNKEINYKQMLMQIKEGIVILDDCVVVFANPAFCDLTKQNLEDVIGISFINFVTSSDRDRVSKYCRRAYEGNTTQSDRTEFSMDLEGHGSVIIDMKFSLIDYKGGPAVLGSLSDITERRMVRLKLAAETRRLQSILEAMTDIVVSLSPVDHTILAINAAAEGLFGVPRRDFISGKAHILDFVHPLDVETVLAFYESLPETEFENIEYRVLGPRNAVRTVNDYGRIIYGEGGRVKRFDHVITDITEQKQAEKELRLSEAKYRSIFDKSMDMIYVVTPEGKFIDVNPAGVKLLGFDSKEDMMSRTIKDLYVDLSERDDIMRDMNEKGHAKDKKVRFKRKNGEVVQVEVTTIARTDDHGRITQYQGIVHNITKILEDERLRVMRNFAGAVCHHMNTHLMTIDMIKVDLEEIAKDVELEMEFIGKEAANPHEKKEDVFPHYQNVLQKVGESRKILQEMKSTLNKLAKVTRGFNKAFMYREEPYVNHHTILDLLASCGVDNLDDL
jgi:PAS domain S-box-containing protein